MTIAALQGNAAAGGVFLALAADCVLARSGIVLNPHYRNMGNLYGSEYWTYLLPRRVGAAQARASWLGACRSARRKRRSIGLIDAHAGPDAASFRALVRCPRGRRSRRRPISQQSLTDKRRRRASDEQRAPARRLSSRQSSSACA